MQKVIMNTMTWANATWSLFSFASPWQAHHSFSLSRALKPNIKSQNDYLREWQHETEDYLDLLLL
jgi:hypothetical protein